MIIPPCAISTRFPNIRIIEDNVFVFLVITAVANRLYEMYWSAYSSLLLGIDRES